MGLLSLWALPVSVFGHAGEHVESGASVPLIAVLGGALLMGLLTAGLLSRLRLVPAKALLAGLTVSILAGGTGYLMATQGAQTEALAVHAELAGVRMEVHKSPGCTCCEGFIAALKEQGAAVLVQEVTEEELSRFKAAQGIDPALQSCHTTLVAGYVVEGHVPFEAIAKLLREKPALEGIALPGMPIGTPGMPGQKTEPYRIKMLSGEEYVTL